MKHLFNWEKYFESKVGDINIADFTKYLTDMEKSFTDKLFFLDMIKPTILVDFGCANASMLSKIQRLRPNIQVIGYDIDKDMLEASKSNLEDCVIGETIEDFKHKSVLTSNWDLISEYVSNKDNCAILLSSVIHEVYSYTNPQNINKFWNSQVFGSNFKWVVIRDMIPEINGVNFKTHYRDVKKVKDECDRNVLNRFEKEWGPISRNYRNFMHYLLKYSYTDNLDRELKENYLPITYETLMTKIPSKYKIKYEDHYILPYLFDKVKNDFGINIRENTHLKMILTRVGRNK